MKKIYVYDSEEKRIDDICEKYDISEAELIEALLDNVTDEEIEELI